MMYKFGAIFGIKIFDSKILIPKCLSSEHKQLKDKGQMTNDKIYLSY